MGKCSRYICILAIFIYNFDIKRRIVVILLGYNEMLSRIKPSKIICYGKPFDEMKGDIIEVDYASRMERKWRTKLEQRNQLLR